MKRLPLDQTWTECLKMWRWVVRQVKAAKAKGKGWNVQDLKTEWMEKQGYRPLEIKNDCFFCEHDGRKGNCSLCPGRKIDKTFYCSHWDYSWEFRPTAFLARVNRLNKIRLAKKKRGE